LPPACQFSKKKISDCLGVQLFHKPFIVWSYCGLEFFFAGKAVFKLISLFKKKLIQVNEKLALTVFLLILSFESFPQTITLSGTLT
jgi:hypothetical protein